jgi:glucose-1-phosphate adenylyltransferase
MRYPIVACILAGGEGTRLLPLTIHRAKPAVRFGGSYRLIDLTLSNCVNSDVRKILVLPQYKVRSLEEHLRQGWSFLNMALDEYVLSIPPPPRAGHIGYRGTVDAVYQNLALRKCIDPAQS